MCLMILIMVLSVPMMLKFASYNDLESVHPDYETNQYSLGNMGGSDVCCAISNLNTDLSVLDLKCRTGLISIDAITYDTKEPIFDAGIMPASSDVNTHCTDNSFTDQRCSDLLDKDKLRA